MSDLVNLENALRVQIKMLSIVNDSFSNYALLRNDTDDSIDIRMRICRDEIDMTTFKLLITEIEKTCICWKYHICSEVSDARIYRLHIIRNEGSVRPVSDEPDLPEKDATGVESQRFNRLFRWIRVLTASVFTRVTMILLLFNVFFVLLCFALLRDLQIEQQDEEAHSNLRFRIL